MITSSSHTRNLIYTFTNCNAEEISDPALVNNSDTELKLPVSALALSSAAGSLVAPAYRGDAFDKNRMLSRCGKGYLSASVRFVAQFDSYVNLTMQF